MLSSVVVLLSVFAVSVVRSVVCNNAQGRPASQQQLSVRHLWPDVPVKDRALRPHQDASLVMRSVVSTAQSRIYGNIETSGKMNIFFKLQFYLKACFYTTDVMRCVGRSR